MQLGGGLTLTWLGHSTFRITSPGGKRLLIDPWVMGNPSCPEAQKQMDPLDLILITHGHYDHIGDAVTIGTETMATTVCIFETSIWLESKGVPNVVGMNKGGTFTFEGIKCTMVFADHSCGILDDGQIIYGGTPCGWVIEFENGYKLYHAGDTNVFGDMRLIADLYQPEVALLPVGGHYVMGPREAAYACRLLGVKKVIPIHFGTFPVLTGTPADLRALTADIEGLEIAEIKPGDQIS